jgi:hypothetical protein
VGTLLKKNIYKNRPLDFIFLFLDFDDFTIGGTLTSNDQQDSKKTIPTLSKRESITRTFELLLHGTAEEQKVEMSLHHQGKELANTTIDSKNIIKLMPAEDKPDSNVNGSSEYKVMYCGVVEINGAK